MTIVDTYAVSKKNNVMKDTWGHLYPKPGSKHSGELVIAVGEYGDEVIVTSDFSTLNSSPQRYYLEHSIFNDDWSVGVYRIKCTLWFFKHCEDMYLGQPVGRIIRRNTQQLGATI